MTREEFIANHLRTCEASPVPKYDPAKPGGGGLHSLEYSRRKCAKNLWRKHVKRLHRRQAARAPMGRPDD